MMVDDFVSRNPKNPTPKLARVLGPIGRREGIAEYRLNHVVDVAHRHAAPHKGHDCVP
jgi:hypothetical protein